MRSAFPVSHKKSPQLAGIVQTCVDRLRPGKVEVYVVHSQEVNAYTFGLTDPKVVVVYSSLLDLMDEDELRFAIGHELGHVALGHTWLNTLLGGMAGIPTSFDAAILISFAFRWWNRACEYSADRAGLLACGNLNKAISALVKVSAGDFATQAEFKRALAMIDAEDDSIGNILAETFSTHPMTIKRINQLKEWGRNNQKLFSIL